jgi:NosR/NirI family nitrous oxide reductase transcriptional regulator
LEILMGRLLAEQPVSVLDPVAVAVRLRPPARDGLLERFTASDPPRGWDVARHPRVARLLKSRRFQFFLILPNQIIFWTVILVGLLGTVVPGLNFGTAITWYVWFCLVFVSMVVVGRAWCAMCPFGGFAEWVQRRTFWRRTQKALGLGRKLPEPVARFGFLIPVATFLLLTWIEEYFNIAGPGAPSYTSWMVVGIVASALGFFLVFERRTFCRYICPLTTLIGTVGSAGMVAGFRTRDRDICLTCPTKDCMRGGEHGFGCPWYTWPGSADSNLYCGLCSECYKACPYDNVGLYLQPPLTSVTAPRRRRIDVAWGIALLWGLVVYQQFNATNVFAAIDGRLNSVLGFPHYPDPVDYLAIIAAVALATAGAAWLIGAVSARRDLAFSAPGPLMERMSRFRSYFAPLAYGIIPVVGADYFARQLPKFLTGAPRVLPAAAHIAGFASTRSALYHTSIVSSPGTIVTIQVAVVVLGALGSLWSMWRITSRDLVPVSRSATAVRIAAMGFVLACAVPAAFLYVIMHAAL